MFTAMGRHSLRLIAIRSQDDVDFETKKNMPCQPSEYATIAPVRSSPEFSSMTLRALLYRRPTEPQAIEVVCDGAVHLVRLRRHRQARRYTLRVVAVTREAVLTMPPRGSFREAREFAERHGAWIAARLDRLPRPAPFGPGLEIPLPGRVHGVAHRRGARGPVWSEIDPAG